ncbi:MULTISPECIES: serine/threonine-protein kinase [unclassified Streptomyces]|uniref:serine/threonine-protein kinase n=1 Tax=unclassified Streptomyces TaxID=2593676 RepID=UPI0022561E6D|nr:MULTISPECIES: serine/threonine-protein kinase [unclassified Streptomyces]MCX5333281.1 serine/threonine protein kinase [Streptomyces sp. NBC_00140]MCX5362699.1 serine/threonine protein kinase [Streptomyces sp. NBC_00124]
MAVLGGGRYELRECLGGGGMGDVWEAEDHQMRRTVAVKLMQSRHLGSAAMQERFLREWQATARLEHENVVRAYDAGWGEKDGLPVMFLVMQRLDGMSLRDRMARARGGRLSVNQVVRWGTHICLALEAAHAEGLVHRDLKPANIQITSREKGSKAVLLDFGIACFQEDEEGQTQITPAGVAVGTPQFMSPEQSEGKPVGAASDLYSLGCVLYVMLTGRPPFRSGDVLTQHQRAVPLDPQGRRADGEIPDQLNDLVMDLLEKRPEKRPASAAVVRSRLAKVKGPGERQRTDARTGQGLRSDAPPWAGQSPTAPRTAPAPQPPSPPPAPTGTGPHLVRHRAAYEITGSALLAGAGTFGLALGAGGATGVSSVGWGLLSLVMFLLLGGLTQAEEFDGEDVLSFFLLPMTVAILVCATWLVAANAAFPWWGDFAIGVGVCVASLFLGFIGSAAGDDLGWSEAGGLLTGLMAVLFGCLGSILVAVHLDFTWWTTLLTGLGLWAAGVALSTMFYALVGP